MHRPELLILESNNVTQPAIENNGGSFGSIVSLNSLLASRNVTGDAAAGRAEDGGQEVAQSYNASFQGVDSGLTPPTDANGPEEVDVIQFLNHSSATSQQFQELSNVFQYWRSFINSPSSSTRLSKQRERYSRVEEAKRKTVYYLECSLCNSIISDRAMRSKLLADSNCVLFSTDSPMNSAVGLLELHYRTATCNCLLRDIACLTCGFIVGYHISHPCESCLTKCTNGHIWLFNRNAIMAKPILDNNMEPLNWYTLLNCDTSSKPGNMLKPLLQPHFVEDHFFR